MESNIALVYMTLNMIYNYNIYLIKFIHIITFNNFLLTRQRLKTASFSHFLVLEREHSFPIFVFRRCTEPNPKDPRSEGIRIATDAKCFSLLST
jgi:hypothetical protein